MSGQVFITASKVPPTRWREAFPDARIVQAIPQMLSSGTLLWLHNARPADLAAVPKGFHVVVLHDRPHDDTGLALLVAGASGYANAHATPQVLQTIDAVVRGGGFWIGESLLSRMLRDVSAAGHGSIPSHESSLLSKLSEREREVALQVVGGSSNKEIAESLDLSERTVKAHLTVIFDKLGVRDRLQLALLLKAGN